MTKSPIQVVVPKRGVRVPSVTEDRRSGAVRRAGRGGQPPALGRLVLDSSELGLGGARAARRKRSKALRIGRAYRSVQVKRALVLQAVALLCSGVGRVDQRHATR
jgi:hypothetical protein